MNLTGKLMIVQRANGQVKRLSEPPLQPFFFFLDRAVNCPLLHA